MNIKVITLEHPSYCFFCECGDVLVWQIQDKHLYCIGCYKSFNIVEMVK